MDSKPPRTELDSILQTDVLVIGGGAAGLRAALEARRQNLQVLLISTFKMGAGNNSAISHGGFSAVDPDGEGDSLDLFWEDTMKAGCGLNRPFLVRQMVEGAWREVKELEKMGVEFLRDSDGNYVRVGRGGHSAPRRLATRAHNGMVLMAPLRRHAQSIAVRSLDEVKAVRLVVADGQIAGALAVNRQSDWMALSAKSVILATGGAGAIYRKHNNAPSATGDGYAMAYEAGLPLQDMEFVQFVLRPVRAPGVPPRLPPVEFLLLNGAQLQAADGRPLLDGRASPRDLTRDAITQAVAREFLKSGEDDGSVFLDLRHLNAQARNEISFLQQYRIRVAPLATYFMGGIRVEDDLRTSIAGLFAAGETVGGIHGANRLGGNALAEAFVFGARTGSLAATFARQCGRRWRLTKQEAIREQRRLLDHFLGTRAENLREWESELQAALEQSAGVIRNGAPLADGIARIQNLRAAVSAFPGTSRENIWEIFTFRNKLLVAEMILRSALKREESRGAHFRLDFPSPDDVHWMGNLCVQQGAHKTMEVFLVPVHPPG